jgi:hypothetical protein
MLRNDIKYVSNLFKRGLREDGQPRGEPGETIDLRRPSFEATHEDRLEDLRLCPLHCEDH